MKCWASTCDLGRRGGIPGGAGSSLCLTTTTTYHQSVIIALTRYTDPAICCSLEVLRISLPLDISEKEYGRLLGQNETMERLQSLHVSCSTYQFHDLAELGNKHAHCRSTAFGLLAFKPSSLALRQTSDGAITFLHASSEMSSPSQLVR